MPSPKSPYDIAVNNQQRAVRISKREVVDAVRAVVMGEGYDSAEVSVAVVDDPTIHRLNRQFLEHDYATDVLSFLFDETADRKRLSGEVIVSADTAARVASEMGHAAADELLLYVIHGTLHLTGYDDHQPEDLATMRDRERHYLRLLSVPLGDRHGDRAIEDGSGGEAE